MADEELRRMRRDVKRAEDHDPERFCTDCMLHGEVRTPASHIVTHANGRSQSFACEEHAVRFEARETLPDFFDRVRDG